MTFLTVIPFFVPSHAFAQQALKKGDTITVSVRYKGTWDRDYKTYYIAWSGAGEGTTAVSEPTLNALWILGEMNGAATALNGKENGITIMAQNLAARDAAEAAGKTPDTERTWFFMQPSNNGSPYLNAKASASTVYTIKSGQGVGQYIDANVMVKSGKTNYYLNYNYWFYASTTNKPQTFHIQKWSSVTESVYRPTFLPSSVIFDWAETVADANNQAVDVTCQVTKREGKYFYNVSDPDQRIVLQQPTETPADPGSVHFAWRNTETQMTFEQISETGGIYHLKVKPVGASPVLEANTMTEPLSDIHNQLICTASFSGKEATGELHCTRRRYMHRQLPTLDFTVTHPTYRFASDGQNEQITLEPILYVQDRQEWINTDGVPEKVVIAPLDDRKGGTTDRYRVEYSATPGVEPGLNVTVSSSAGWLQFPALQPLGIPLQAHNNKQDGERSAVVVINVDYTYYKWNNTTGTFDRDAGGNLIPLYHGTFIRQITVYQPGKNKDPNSIQFSHKGELDAKGQQKVHTNKKVLYYVPGNGSDYGGEVELRPAETSFYGYRRWYNYDTGHGIQNSESANDNTIWQNAPRVTSGTTTYQYTPINANTDSRGLFAIAQSGSTPSGYRLLASGMNDGIPVIKGYKNRLGGPNNDGVHHIACDLSNYIDYNITESDGKLTAITEPTLSYRMLFELRPANEIADALRALPSGKYLEEYEYTAPTGVDVHLVTSQRYRTYRYHKSELGYYYYNSGVLTQIQGTNSTITWKKDGVKIDSPTYSSNTDNLIVSSRSAGDVVYTLEINAGGTRCIAKFTVHYMAPTEVGPSAIALLTDKEIEDHYQVLETIDFDYVDNKPADAANQISRHHLNWEDATFGFAYRNPNIANNRRTNDGLCFYGEYLLINHATNWSWLDQNVHNRSGRENGYMLYVDGTLEPGMVASIQTDAQICSGQQMYCSAWVANASPSSYSTGSNPIFRFHVQGRNADNEEWQDVEIFFAGELPKGSGWRQVKFPVNSHKSYSQTRVCLYNFATTNSGNDFFVDDIRLFASPLPISAYQASSACSGEDIAIVVKVDYQNVADEIVNRDIYYQGWVDIKNPLGTDTITISIPDLGEFNGYYLWYDNGTYYTKSKKEVETNGANHTQDMGKIHIPAKSFVPAPADVYPDVQAYIDHMHELHDLSAGHHEDRAGVFYVKNADDKTYSMYLAHLLRARDGGNYEVRFADDYLDLPSPLCAMSVKLPIYKKTKLTWGENDDPITTPMLDVCPNVNDEIKVTVTNTHIADNESSGVLQTTYGRADWLIGIAADTIFGAAYQEDASPRKAVNPALTLQQWKDSADKVFEKFYGYTRAQVQSAFVYDLRRMPYINHPNANYDVSDYTKLDPHAFLSEENYTIVKDLCSRGLVEMNASSRTVMLTPGDSLFLWVFPIVGSAHTSTGEELAVCNEPQWVDFRTSKQDGISTEQIFNPSPIANKDKTPVQKLTVPSIRVTASKVNTSFRVPLMDINNAVLAWDSLRVIQTNDPALSAQVAAYDAAYNAWKNEGAQYPDPELFSMRYYADRVFQGTNGEKYYLEDGTTPNPKYHSDTKDGSNWKRYAAGDTIIFRPINATYISYLQDRREKSSVVGTKVNDVDQFSVYSQSDANWITKTASEGTSLQPGWQHPNTAGTTMKANYTYHMTTKLITNAFEGELNSSSQTESDCNFATTYFDVIVVPELLIWRPTVSNEWGNDANWHGVVNGVEMDWGFAPLSTSSVIIPAMENELLYPVVTGTNLYPMSAWYEPANCDNIYMEAGAHILGQEKLTYNKAYVDMPVAHSQWQAMATPMRKMYSGDFFIPHTGMYYTANSELEVLPYQMNENGFISSLKAGENGTMAENGDLFDPAGFTGTRSSDAAYAFWTSYYNHTATMYNYGTDENQYTVTAASAAFAPSNALDEVITAGQGITVLGYGPWDEGEKHTLNLRLPKQDTQYNYFLCGEQTSYSCSTPRTEEFTKFAWKTDDGQTDRMTVTITNEVAGKNFLLGNPTMAYVDLVEFMKDNSGVLSGTFSYMNNDHWVVVSSSILEISGHRFLAPMEAILVETKAKATTLSVVFKAEHLTLDNMTYHAASAPARAPQQEDVAEAPSRANTATADVADANATIELMTITAFTDDLEAVAYLGKRTGARHAYLQGEDAFFLSSGLEEGANEDALLTPMNIYTVSDTNTLMVDLRPGICSIPLHFLVHDDYRSDMVNIIFNMNREWSSECYLVDSIAGTRERIYNGKVMQIFMPQNHQDRYFIEGPDTFVPDPELPTQGDTPTAVEDYITSEQYIDFPVEKILIDGHVYLRRGTTLFHVTGRRVK